MGISSARGFFVPAAMKPHLIGKTASAENVRSLNGGNPDPMYVTSSKPVGDGVVTVPGSKSYTHRVLIAAALANGKTKQVAIFRSGDMRTSDTVII